MVGDALRIAALDDAYNFLRKLEVLLLHNLEVADDIHSCIRSNEGKLAEFLILEESVLDLDDTLAALSLAVQVDSDGDLILDAFEVQEIESPIYIFRRYMVQYGSILQRANY